MFLEDDTIQIREVPQLNSGFVGGVFLSRSRQFHPNEEQILLKDIYIGKELVITSFEFLVVNADEATIKYMENYSDMWPKYSRVAIAAKLKANEGALSDILLELKDRALQEIPYAEITQRLLQGGIKLDVQEALFLNRAIDKQKKGTAKFFRIYKYIQEAEFQTSLSA